VAAVPVGEKSKSGRPRALETPTQGLTEDDARRFVQRYLQIAEGSDPDDEAACYADHVDYFADGMVDHPHIQRDQAIYYKRWPSRRFTLLGEPEVLKLSPNEATVRFRVRFDLKSPKEQSRGETEEVMRVAQTAKGFKIIGIRERKL